MAVFDFVDYSVFWQYDFDIIRPVYMNRDADVCHIHTAFNVLLVLEYKPIFFSHFNFSAYLSISSGNCVLG